MPVTVNGHYENTGTGGYPGQEYIVAADLEPCWHCDRPTSRIEINFAARICCTGCLLAKDHEFWSAVSIDTDQVQLPFP
jgi:hypothetical protein